MEIVQVFACALLGSIVTFALVRMFYLFSNKLGRFIYPKLLRHVIYPRLFRQKYFFNPSRIEFALWSLHWAVTGFCNLYRIGSLAEAGLRAGSIAMIHLIPLLAVPQLSMWSHYLGASLSACQSAHRAFGLMAAAQGIFHACIAIQLPSIATPFLASSVTVSYLRAAKERVLLTPTRS